MWLGAGSEFSKNVTLAVVESFLINVFSYIVTLEFEMIKSQKQPILFNLPYLILIFMTWKGDKTR